ncbi:hypothetical protein FB45DRAFT_478351 [Roridomyces roridus]|uniref:DNA replication regulator Sld3 C-terminal domain-containing protein n=1 Tax=Roridomyces roridus TaxID=1738132 RepID=A0AAD7BZH7_9AGAR|nr:hypothetical protein FB45DRAFT_478351 [Roridomyces roridus]
MAVQTLQYHIPDPRVPWNATQEKSISQDYPLVLKTPESGEDFTARTYFQFLWLPESIMPLGLFVPSLLRVVQHQPLHELLERLLSTTRMVKNKYHEELPRILANGGGEGEEEESMMWYAVAHEKSEGDEDEPWHNETWRTTWMERMERREVQIQILLYMLKLSLPAALPPPEASSPSRKRRKVEPPPASLEDRLEAFMDKLSTWQLAKSLEEGLLHRSRDRDWMQVFCEDVVEPRFKATLPDQVELLRSKVFPHSPFSDSEGSEDEQQRATSPDLPAKSVPSAGLSRKTLEEPVRSRSRSLSITLAQEREREQQREGSVGAKRRVLTREVSMKRAFKPRERDDKSVEAQRKLQREKEQEEEKAKAEEVRLAAIRAREGVTLVLATPVKSRSRSITFSKSEEMRGGSPDPLAMDI